MVMTIAETGAVLPQAVGWQGLPQIPESGRGWGQVLSVFWEEYLVDIWMCAPVLQVWKSNFLLFGAPGYAFLFCVLR